MPKSIWTLVVIAAVVSGGCATTGKVGQTEIVEGCARPITAMQAKGIAVETEANYFEKVKLGVKIKSDPQVKSIASASSANAEVSSYLDCRSQKMGWTNEQVMYRHKWDDFIGKKDNPTADELRVFEEKNPNPFQQHQADLHQGHIQTQAALDGCNDECKRRIDPNSAPEDNGAARAGIQHAQEGCISSCSGRADAAKRCGCWRG